MIKPLLQTLHPESAPLDLAEAEGWRKGSWKGFSTSFRNPAPWYFRTLESWKELFRQNNLNLCEIREPQVPGTQSYASIIFVAERSADT